MALDQLERVRDDGERRQAQEVHLEERQLLQAVHVVLRDNFVFVGLVERDDVAQRQRRNHNAGRVNAGVARHAFQALGYFQNLFYFGIRAGQRIELRLHLARLLQLDVERHGGDQLGDAVDFGVAHVEHAAHVFDGRARAHGAEGDDLGHLLAPVFFGDVLNHFAAPASAEIDIDIGHGDALGIQEALEQQPVGERIDVGDLHGVTDQAAGGGTAARAHGNVALLGEADEIPDDQEVAGELHRLDHLDLAIQAFGVFGEIVLQVAFRGQGFQASAAFFETLARDVFEEGVGGVILRNREARERFGDFFELELAALRDVPGAVERVLDFAEERHHLFARLDVEGFLLEAHPVQIRHRLAGLNAQQDFVGAGVGLAQVVGIVGGDERDAGVGREAMHQRHDFGRRAPGRDPAIPGRNSWGRRGQCIRRRCGARLRSGLAEAFR